MKLPSIPAAMVDKDHVPLSDEPLHLRFAKAVLLFHRGGQWTQADHTEWRRLTGTPLCTTKAIGDMARLVLEQKVP